MLRFEPDGWLQALLRPLIMADPNAGIYFERAAPDLRFAMVLLALAVLLVSRRRAGAPIERTGWALLIMFAVWTIVIGNGRYFLTGLLLVGPLLIALIVALPGTPALRASLVALALLLQGGVVWQSFSPGQWAMARWSQPPGLPLAADSPMPTQPATFLTISSISHSLLVPQFDSRSRWANVAGQYDILPGKPEWPALQAALAAPLPKYVVMPTMPERPVSGSQPSAGYRWLADRTLARYGLRTASQPCLLAVSGLTMQTYADGPDGRRDEPLGYWFCQAESAPAVTEAMPSIPPDLAKAAAALERRCPRWFPAGTPHESMEQDVLSLFYRDSEMRVYVAPGGVYIRYTRALNPTRVGALADVAAGRFQLDCRTMPGRYQFPWERS